MLTLEGICDHFCFTESSRDRIKKALDAALSNTIELFYQNKRGLLDLRFSIYKNKLMISVEDLTLSLKEKNEDNLSVTNDENVRNMLKTVEEFTDGISFSDKKGRNACYSMAFNVAYMEEAI